MVNEATISKLYEMKLSAMAASYRQQIDDSGITKLSFDERFGLMVDTEWTTRKNNRLKRLICSADFPISSACVEDIQYRADRKLDREQILQFESCAYIGERHNIIILRCPAPVKPISVVRWGCRPAVISIRSSIFVCRISWMNFR